MRVLIPYFPREQVIQSDFALCLETPKALPFPPVSSLIASSSSAWKHRL